MSVELEKVDRAEVYILSDNYCDQITESSAMVFRPGGLTVKPGEQEVRLKAEHGFAAAVRLYKGKECRTVLLDTGRSGEVLLNNADWIGLDLDDVEAVVISHGHPDHFGGLSAAAKRFSHPVPVIVHPDAFQERYIRQADGSVVKFPDFYPELFAGTNLEFRVSREPVLLAGDMALATGKIPRRTDYEKGFPPQMAMRKDILVSDSAMEDDQSLVFYVRGKGPVIISGCGHAGIINSAGYGMELAGGDTPLAVIGGFHLCRPTPGEVVRKTFEDMKKIGPRYIVPCHCTGWEAVHLFSLEMPESFILSTVGCKISF